jgi:DNA-binding transcriptional LysR family regulator
MADERLDFESLFDDSFVVAVGEQNQWARRRRIELSDLVNEPWVLPPPESSLASVAMEAFRNSGLDFPRATVFAVSPEIRIGLLSLGRFLTMFPTSVLKFPTKRPGIEILPVKLPVSRAPIGTVTLRDRTLSPLARIFIDEAREVAKPLAKRK